MAQYIRTRTLTTLRNTLRKSRKIIILERFLRFVIIHPLGDPYFIARNQGTPSDSCPSSNCAGRNSLPTADFAIHSLAQRALGCDYRTWWEHLRYYYRECRAMTCSRTLVCWAEVCPRPQTSCAGSPVQRSQPSGKGHGRQTLVRHQPRNKRDGHPCLTRNNMQRQRWDSMVHSAEGSFTRSFPTSQHSPGAILERLFVETSVH